jgi:5-deoxy-D-glucuronate isomerase
VHAITPDSAGWTCVGFDFHRLQPAQGFAFQRVFTGDGKLDETISASDHDVVLVPRGIAPARHPMATSSGV